MRTSSILGLNARSQLFSYRYNKKKGRKICNSKILTERVLRKAGLSVPKIYKIFRKPKNVLSFNWDSLASSFALKPSRGLGGEGIVVVKKRAKNPTEGWITTQRKKVNIGDLKLHTLNILEGAYSMGNVPDVAFIQEYIGRHKAFRKYAYRGTPDIRIIVFNKVPVMAMLRLPTKESGGRANLHQGAIGVGVDIATGITTKAIWHAKFVRFKPGSQRKLNGIKIPCWSSILRTAIEAQIVSDMGYLGVDIVLHPEKDPMVLELNAQPGLSIQLANVAGLRKRLEKVEDLEVRDSEHGVKIAKALFAARFADRVHVKEGVKTIRTREMVKIITPDRKKVEIMAKIDTGAWRSSIDVGLAKELGLLRKENVLWQKTIKSSLGKEVRQVISLKYYLAGRKVVTIATVADRTDLKRLLIIGRRDLKGFNVMV